MIKIKQVSPMIRLMKLSLLFAFAIGFLLVSCRKENDDPSPDPDLDGGILLEIKPDQNSYISENNNRFYTNVFSHKNDSNLYHLKVKSGVKYRMFCTQPDLTYTSIKMVLLTSKRDTISISRNEEGRSEIYFEPSVPDDLYLLVYLKSSINETLKYNLYFEELTPAALNFMNLNWQTTGNWQVINSQTLEFNGSDSRKFRWIRLNSIISDNQDISFTIKSATRAKLPSFGIILSGSSELVNWGEYKEQLPQLGTLFNFTDNESYRIIHLGGTGMSFDYGTMTVPNMNINSGVNITIEHPYPPNKSVFINNIGLYSINPASMNKFYLVIEDKGFDKIVFENLKFKEY
jgi:hypothetical protein